jgi:hypothetical protein
MEELNWVNKITQLLHEMNTLLSDNTKYKQDINMLHTSRMR